MYTMQVTHHTQRLRGRIGLLENLLQLLLFWYTFNEGHPQIYVLWESVRHKRFAPCSRHQTAHHCKHSYSEDTKHTNDTA